MSIILTPDQQAKLEDFEQKATEAVAAKRDAGAAAQDLLIAQDRKQRTAQLAVDDLNRALESAQAFIASMLPTDPAPTPTGTPSGMTPPKANVTTK